MIYFIAYLIIRCNFIDFVSFSILSILLVLVNYKLYLTTGNQFWLL